MTSDQVIEDAIESLRTRLIIAQAMGADIIEVQVNVRCSAPAGSSTIEFVDEMVSGGEDVGLVKHGTGEVIPEDEQEQKTASKNWTEEDRKALAEENEE